MGKEEEGNDRASTNNDKDEVTAAVITIHPLSPEDAPAVTRLWVDGLQQTRDAVASHKKNWIVVGLLVSTMMDRLETKALSDEGHMGPNGSNLCTFWTEQPDRQFFVAKKRRQQQGKDSNNREEEAEEGEEESGDIVVGCVGVKRGIYEDRVELDSLSASVWNVSVHENCRRLGIGTMLMEHAENWAKQKEQSCTRMHLFTGNPKARAFYKTLGYHDNHWILPSMEKSLLTGELMHE
mmetsp:Transcript_58815/g.143872  ORF Transcript_58815/g.143872 Transcript_58815/m.143872 type:complete len:237 (-) Transcript_58815:60-770(-)|eukprot:CAMPEP_0113465434 /NCGR_PEP_ID=MMETSP0014_2-20120614/13739_1 /TAXON_ID=2857 /ORGANISM="Nitzschia sp." /LENGTH=236 /DNA_ID=CAMNT_0000357595 /DNA_START=312 /DNA_END=1022 /DNA_ORIENTATION=- /assembly_acc=CAM_ASM_000159